MVQTWVRVSLFAALGVVVTCLSAGSSRSADEKTPTIKEIMTEGHKGTDAFLTKIGKEAKAAKWEDAATHAKALAVFGEALGKNKAPKGNPASWEKLAKKYHDNTAAVLKAVEKKDAAGTDKALKTIQASCGECHKAHKGK
jgi:hypothetical protein